MLNFSSILLILPLAAQSSISPFSADYRDAQNDLYQDLLFDYKREVRPVRSPTDVLLVKFGAYLVSISDVDERKQIMTTSLWLDMTWFDKRLQWDPLAYGNITTVHIPSTELWTPDVVLENNAAGNPQITIFTNVKVTFDGTVRWNPPAIFQSYCPILVAWFPFDEQFCAMKFIMWTHEGQYVELNFHDSVLTTMSKDSMGNDVVMSSRGMDLSYYSRSAEWDLLETTATRSEKVYPGCCGSKTYFDITYNLHLRRMTLFYTINLIIPCMVISILSLLTFYLPSASYEKMTLSISIQLSLSYMFLLLYDIIPPTSITLPMLLRYILFDLILVTASIMVSIFQLNLYCKEGFHHEMTGLTRKIFLIYLPKLLRVEKPKVNDDEEEESESVSDEDLKAESLLPQLSCYVPSKSSPILKTSGKWSADLEKQLPSALLKSRAAQPRRQQSRRILTRRILTRMAGNLRFISEYYRAQEERDEISEEWMYLALVVDRLSLWFFTVATLVGTVAIVFTAPTIYDTQSHVELPSTIRRYE